MHACIARVGQCWAAAVQEALRGLALAVPHLAKELGRWRWATVAVLLSLMWRVVVLVSLLIPVPLIPVPVIPVLVIPVPIRLNY